MTPLRRVTVLLLAPLLLASKPTAPRLASTLRVPASEPLTAPRKELKSTGMTPWSVDDSNVAGAA